MALLLFLVMYCIWLSGILNDVHEAARRYVIRVLTRWLE
jgi:hypothetical protein